MSPEDRARRKRWQGRLEALKGRLAAAPKGGSPKAQSDRRLALRLAGEWVAMWPKGADGEPPAPTQTQAKAILEAFAGTCLPVPQAAPQAITVGELRRLLEHLPDDALLTQVPAEPEVVEAAGAALRKAFGPPKVAPAGRPGYGVHTFKSAEELGL